MMPEPSSTTRWRDQPIIPTDYSDVHALVKLAHRARRKVVEFDWVFSDDELRRMRRAVFEWGSGVRGSYRCFDARVLAAINQAFAEPQSLFALVEPKGFEALDCSVSCIPDGDRFRLKGHATFDLVFGYGEVGVQESGEGRALLGPAVRAKLAANVGQLEWDLRRLQDDRFIPVRNVMYGFAPGLGATKVPPHPGPEVRIPLAFNGPFSAGDDGDCRCLFTEPIAASSGIYLWTVEVDGACRPWYVGQTRRGFGQRMGEHLASMLSGQYTPQDPAALSRGENRRSEGAFAQDWPRTLPSFLRNWATLIPDIMATIRLLRFYVAPLAGDVRLHDRVEGAIGRYYKTHPVIALSDFFSPGLRVPAAIPGEQPMRLVLSSESPIAGLPLEILEPPAPLPREVREFVESTSWTSAKTYATTWPHEYIVRTPDNAQMLLRLATHIFEHGVAGRFYSEERRYHHESGKVYWSMDPTPEDTDLVNRCEEGHTYEARLAAGTLPPN